MSLVSAFEIEIQDLGDTSGVARLMWVRTHGGTDGNILSTVKTRHNNQANRAPVPIIGRAIGPSIGLNMFDPVLTAVGRGASGQYYNKSNSNWGSDTDAAIISSEGYAPSNSLESAFFQNIFEGSHVFSASLQGTTTPAGSRRGRLDILRPTGLPFWQTSRSLSGASGAWLSYNMSGEQDKNIYAYAFEIVAELSGTGAQGELTGQDYKASELLYLTGTSYSGACSDISLILSNTGESCNYPPGFLEAIQKTKYQCVPKGFLGDDALLSGYIATGLQQVAFELEDAGRKAKDSDKSQVSSETESFSYSIYEGLIAYNYPYSGDYISFYPYAYNYTGTYNEQFGVNPPYPAETVTLYYGQDYSGVDSLVNAINQSLSGSGQFLWNKQLQNGSSLCSNDRLLSGFFESGGLLKASRSGNNGILIQSLRAGDVGKYQISFYEAARPSGITRSSKTKLLLPSNVYIEGSTDSSSWSVLNSFQPQWDKAPSMYVDIDRTEISLITGNVGYVAVNPKNSGESSESGIAPITTIYSGKVSSTSKCGEVLSRDVEFYKIEGPFPCIPTGTSKDKEEEKGYLVKTGVMGSGIVTDIPAKALVYKTGAKYSATGDYNYYRLRFENLKSSQQGELSDVSNIMYVSRVTFFGVKSGEHLLSGQTCILGADYSGQVLGYTTGLLTGTITGQANESGLLNLDRYRVTRTPQAPVIFQYSQGQPVGAFTGLVTAVKTGTGYYSDVVQGYYYNSGDDCVYFQAPVSGVISGSGQMTGGPYLLLKDEFVQSLSENYQYISGWESGNFTGLIPDFTYSATDIPSFYQYSSYVTGRVGTGDAGYFDASRDISLIPTGDVYSIALSGTHEASAAILFNSPATGDTVTVNGIPFIYSSESGDLYYNSKASLASKISDNASVNATGVESGLYVFLRSTALGESGNNIQISYSGGAGKPTGPSFFTGGRDIHYPLTANQEFTGYLDSGIYAVQYFQTGGSGYLTGEIKQLDFVRHFSGVWDLISGDTSFRESGKYLFGKYINSGFETLQKYSGRPDYIPLTLVYNNSPYVSTVDLVRLTVTGYDSSTGLLVIISGKVI